MSEVYYVVQTLRLWSTLTVFGLPLGGYKDADGCIGCLPVFDSAEKASAWRDENGPTADIAAITSVEAAVPS